MNMIKENMNKKILQYYIITIGCQMNKSDSERLEEYLDNHGHRKASKRILADFVILNTCGIRQKAEDRAYGLIHQIKKDNKNVKVVITGCLSIRRDVVRRMKGKVDFFIPINKMSNLNSLLIGDKKKERIKDYLKFRAKYKSKISAFVPIGNGCDNFCSYCVVPYARGREVYRSVNDILVEVKALVKNGCKEIILIAQNVNSYKAESGKLKVEKVDFAKLLRLVNDIEGEFLIRFSSSHPKDMSDDLIMAIAECEKVCEHVHLAVQAGDDEILKRMNRKYTCADYLNLVKKIKKHIKGHSITTDIIVGFPGETEEQFNNTKKLFKEVDFDMAYISQYSPRPGTVAEKLKDDVGRDEKKKREESLMKILKKNASKISKKFLNKRVKVLIEGKNKKGEYYGKTRSFKMVKCFGDENMIGKIVEVKIDKVEEFIIRGKIVK